MSISTNPPLHAPPHKTPPQTRSIHDLAHDSSLPFAIPPRKGEKRIVRVGKYQKGQLQDFAFWRVGVWPPPPKEERPGLLVHAFITRTELPFPGAPEPETPSDGDRFFYTLGGTNPNLDPLTVVDKRINPHERVRTLADPFCFLPENHQIFTESYGGPTHIGPIVDPLTCAPHLPAVATVRTERILFPNPGQWWCRVNGAAFNKLTGLPTRNSPFPEEGGRDYRRLKGIQEGDPEYLLSKRQRGVTKRQVEECHLRATRVEEVIYWVHEHPGCINNDLLRRLHDIGCTNLTYKTDVIRIAVETGLVTRERDNNKIRFMPNINKKNGKKKKGKKK